MKKPLKARSFIAVIDKSTQPSDSSVKPLEPNQFLLKSRGLEISFSLREKHLNMQNSSLARDGVLLLGDNSEWSDAALQKSMGNAVAIYYDLNRRHIKLLTSIVGLPAVFLHDGPSRIVITSDLHLLTTVPGLDLYFDVEGINDFSEIGHPIEHRTLFKNTSMLPAGHSVEITDGGKIITRKSWSLPAVEAQSNWESYTELQIDEFNKSMDRIDISETFLSLTAGLDTRTILAKLIEEQKKMTAYTMSGKVVSLDAKIASILAKKYGMKHSVIILDKEFYKNLPDYIVEASRLSGGLASLEQSTEVFFNSRIGSRYTARLSGNLGNQIGRRGVEKISLRNADPSVLADDLAESIRRNSKEHWYADKTKGGVLDYEFLLNNEIPFSSVANYCIGNHFFIQQTPYANSRLIEAAQFAPVNNGGKEPATLLQLRLKDLRHRFLGEPEAFSFQRKLINRIGGAVASCPINWGWRAKGGMSFSGLIGGTLTFADAIAYSKGFDSGIIGRGLEIAHIAGLHEFRHHKTWMRSYLKEFVIDTLTSNDARNSGLFNFDIINKMLSEHFSSETCHYKALSFALDLALAQKLFNIR